jgi:chromosome segregation ATPase
MTINKSNTNTNVSTYNDDSISTTNESVSNKNNYKNKLDSIMTNYELEKEQKKQEIKELSNKLELLLQNIMNKSETIQSNEEIKTEVKRNIENLTITNEDILREIEEKLETFEQLQKLSNSEIKEEDLTTEVETLEKKYEEMNAGWEEYSSQMKSKIEDLKINIETKKKEYSYKYDKIGSLKKEIDEISTKIVVKQEMANFLNEEYQKIPIDINRNKFINMISDLTNSIAQEKKNILTYLNDLKNAEDNIITINETIKKVDDELEDRLFKVK